MAEISDRLNMHTKRVKCILAPFIRRDDVDGKASVTKDEERVLRGG